MTPHADPLDPQIARFAREATPEMSTAQAASILGVSKDTVQKLCNNGVMRAKAMQDARHESSAERERRIAKRLAKGKPVTQRDNTLPKRQWTITKQALMTYIVQSVCGDKTLILSAVRELCPRWLPVAEAAAQHAPESRPATEPRELPANVIPMRRKRMASAPDDHPDLFPPAQQAG